MRNILSGQQQVSRRNTTWAETFVMALCIFLLPEIAISLRLSPIGSIGYGLSVFAAMLIYFQISLSLSKMFVLMAQWAGFSTKAQFETEEHIIPPKRLPLLEQLLLSLLVGTLAFLLDRIFSISSHPLFGTWR